MIDEISEGPEVPNPELAEGLDTSRLIVEDVPVSDAFATPDPRRGRRQKAPKPEKPVKEKARVPNRKGQFVQPLTQMYSGIGAMVFQFDKPCGTAVLASAEQCAKSLDDLAYQNESVRRALATLTQGSALGAVIVAHGPIIMAVMAHHAGGVLPAQFMPQTDEQEEQAA
jgi:hypothetical protein